jgi:hypothetical protein
VLKRILLLLIAGIYRDSLIISFLGAVSLFGTSICTWAEPPWGLGGRKVLPKKKKKKI